jgi:hypothetical protein
MVEKVKYEMDFTEDSETKDFLKSDNVKIKKELLEKKEELKTLSTYYTELKNEVEKNLSNFESIYLNQSNITSKTSSSSLPTSSFPSFSSWMLVLKELVQKGNKYNSEDDILNNSLESEKQKDEESESVKTVPSTTSSFSENFSILSLQNQLREKDRIIQKVRENIGFLFF